jgi:hypothetical protein
MHDVGRITVEESDMPRGFRGYDERIPRRNDRGKPLKQPVYAILPWIWKASVLFVLASFIAFVAWKSH